MVLSDRWTTMSEPRVVGPVALLLIFIRLVVYMWYVLYPRQEKALGAVLAEQIQNKCWLMDNLCALNQCPPHS